MIEIDACGVYPANLEHDITNLVEKIKNEGYSEADFVLLTPFRYKKTFNYNRLPTGYSYGGWLINNELIYDIIEDNTITEDAIYVYATNKGFPFTQNLENIKMIIPNSIGRINKVGVTW